MSITRWIVLTVIILILPHLSEGEEMGSSSARLVTMRSARHDAYTTLVFEMDRAFTFRIHETGNGMEIFLSDTRFPEGVTERFFRTGLSVTLLQNGKDLRALVRSRTPFRKVMTDTLKNPFRLALHFYPQSTPPKAPPTKKEKSVSISFFNGDIREILSALAIQQGINIVAEPEVQGKISVHLNDLPLETTIDAIARSGSFRYRKKGEIYYIYRPEKEPSDEGEGLELKIFKLRYAETEKIQEVLSAIKGIRLIKIHEPTKTVIVEDTPFNIKRIEALLKIWDEAPIQVLIEAKILEISLTEDMSFGVNWQRFFDEFAIGTGGFSTSPLPGTGNVSPIPSKGSGLFANIITGAGTDLQFSAALSALQSKTHVETLSSPKILAIHGKKAKVQVGGKQGYRVATTNLGVVTESIEFIDTGTILEITPYIDKTGSTLLNVTPSINTARIEEGGIPVVNSTVVSTWLKAKDGETVFIGGLIQNSNRQIRNSIPCMGKIPLLGHLFGNIARGNGKTELVVLIKTRVISDPADGMESFVSPEDRSQ